MNRATFFYWLGFVCFAVGTFLPEHPSLPFWQRLTIVGVFLMAGATWNR